MLSKLQFFSLDTNSRLYYACSECFAVNKFDFNQRANFCLLNKHFILSLIKALSFKNYPIFAPLFGYAKARERIQI